MTTLTIYTDKFDSQENILNDGLSGKAFLDMDNQLGTPFLSIDEALEYVIDNNISISRIEFNYLNKDGVQMFKKFNVE